MKENITIINEITARLTPELVQLLKDTINKGSWGDTDMNFVENGKDIQKRAMGYITNDAHLAGHFSGKKMSAMFREMYRRLGLVNGTSQYIAQISDWWEDGSGDVMFIRDDNGLAEEFEKWANA